MIPEKKIQMEQAKKAINEFGDKLLGNLKSEKKFLVTLHTIEDGKINHSYLTNEFPNGDLMLCVGYLEGEFVEILKRGATGNGRM